jgi:hypothetical protein
VYQKADGWITGGMSKDFVKGWVEKGCKKISGKEILFAALSWDLWQ